MYRHETIGGYGKKSIYGWDKNYSGEGDGDARDFLYQGKRPMSKEVNIKMCDILHQSIG